MFSDHDHDHRQRKKERQEEYSKLESSGGDDDNNDDQDDDHEHARIMNTDNISINGSCIGGPSDPYSHHHHTLTQHHHLLPPHHSQHPSSMYCSSSNPYAELFSPFSTEFVTPHDTSTHGGISSDYLNLQNSLDYAVSHHHHHQQQQQQQQQQLQQLQQQQQQQQQQQHHHHQIASSSNGERTSSSIINGISGSDSSPSHSFGRTNGYSSAMDYYNATVLTSKTNLNTSNGNASNNSNISANNTNIHSPYDGTSTASTSSPPHSTGYLTTTIKQENMIPPSFSIDPHSNYGNRNVNGTTSATSTSTSGNNSSNSNFGLGVDDYGSSLYHPSANSTYSSYSPTGLLQTSYPVGPYGVAHPDHMRMYSSQLKHDFGIDMRFKLVGNQRASPNADISPSQLCAVCQDTAQCQHYGVRTCEGCKGFFKRTVQKNAKYVCLADKNCPVDKRRRNRCQYCRFQTCLAVGMDKEVVRTDALKGRRGRLPSKPKSPNSRQPNSFQTQFCRFYNDSIPNPASLDFSKLNYRTVTSKENLCEEKLLVYDAFTRSCDIIKQWVDKFSLFYSIQNNERDRLYSNCLLEQIIFRTAARVDGDRVILCSGTVIHKIQMNYLLGDVAQQLYDYSSTLKLHKIDTIAAATLASILLLDSNNTEYVYHQTPLSSTVTELYQKIIDSLKDYLKQQYGDSSIYLQLLDRLNDARRIAHHLRKRLLLYRHSVGLTNAMPTFLDLILEGKSISSDLNPTEDTSALPFIQYDL
ncbi:unnamed protein product [Rotaria magnacalcarata]|uniref:Uncharacterized protein n=5 Tax=Rotaria magnacalcarata TaxID=392030 RepID=A0A818WA04_9BILA|nr:unnamed protein product [Rotaria magnacalcarata]